MTMSKLGLQHLVNDMREDTKPSGYADAESGDEMNRGEFELRMLERGISYRQLVNAQYSGCPETAGALLSDLGVINIMY